MCSEPLYQSVREPQFLTDILVHGCDAESDRATMTPTRRGVERTSLPAWVKPQLAALVKNAPDGPATTMSPKTTRRSWMRLRAIPPIPFLIWVVGPAETYATSDHWATTSWVWTDRQNWWPWHAPIRSARFSNRISSPGHYRRAASMASLRMHRCSACRARSCRGFWRNSPKPCDPGMCFSAQTREETTRKA
jgi:hypothetical protein